MLLVDHFLLTNQFSRRRVLSAVPVDLAPDRKVPFGVYDKRRKERN